jgi:DNA-binding Lrp family transcriptional regulator
VTWDADNLTWDQTVEPHHQLFLFRTSYINNMPGAIVIINTDIGQETVVLDALSHIPQVQSAYVVYGVYDLVALVSAPSMEELEALLSVRLRKVPGVRSTLTLVVSKEMMRD